MSVKAEFTHSGAIRRASGTQRGESLCSPLALSSVLSLHFPALTASARGASGPERRRDRNAPVAPPARVYARTPASANWSGRRDLNPRHSAWEADALEV